MAGDPFLSDPSKKRKRAPKPTHTTKKLRAAPAASKDAEISSDESATSGDEAPYEREDGHISSDEEFEQESAADKRRRLAKQYLENLKAHQGTDGDYDAQELDDDIVGRRLAEDVAENRGHVYKFFAERVQPQLEAVRRSGARVGLRNLTAVAVRYPYAYTVAKDMELIKWRLGSNGKPARVRHSRGGPRHAALNRTNPAANHHCDQINTVAVSPDGKYVVTGGSDARLIIWAAESLACLKVMETRAAVNAVAFRRGTDQLYAACADLRIRTFSINQFAQLEILYGHQDNITDIAALARELCVSVGLRDKTAMYWKIAEELRLTFRGGDGDKRRRDDESTPFHAEGLIEAVTMVDESHFVTGLDNGTLALWALSKKKPLHTVRVAHGLPPAADPGRASAEANEAVAVRQVPPPQPYWITAVYAVPYSDLFVSGSYSGDVRVWRVDRELFRAFSLVGSLEVKGCVVGIDGAETDGKLVLAVATSKEHRLGRWLRVEGRNALTTLTFDIA